MIQIEQLVRREGYHPPLSATTSTPSSAGHHSIPRTPAALPSHTSYYFSTTHGGLLSPHPPYNPCYPPAHSPVSPSPSLLAPPVSLVSPSALNNSQTVWDIACRFPGADNIIKQRPYRPNTQSDRRRYVEEVDLERPIMFLAANGETCGIRCSDAMSSRFSSLYGRDDPMFENRGPSVSIRLMVRRSFIYTYISLILMIISGRAMLPGAARSQPATSGVPHSPSPAPNWPKM